VITIYLCFLAGGAVLPIISFALGFLSNGADTDIDTDVDADFDADADPGADAGPDTGTGADSHISSDIHAGAGGESFFALGLLPTSLLSISALAITFGAVGSLMTIGSIGKYLTFFVAVIVGYAASVIVQTILKSLKKVQTFNNGINENELLLYDGKVVDTILPGQLGTVSFLTLKNVLVSYPARCADQSLRLETGKIVKVLEFKDGIFIVEPKNKYEQ